MTNLLFTPSSNVLQISTLENELEKRDEVIKTLKRQMSGMLSVLDNVEDEQN